MQLIDLNRWHHALHEVTGDMAIRFNTATIDDLKRWAGILRVIADEMDLSGVAMAESARK
jgi:hypothetical protein